MNVIEGLNKIKNHQTISLDAFNQILTDAIDEIENLRREADKWKTMFFELRHDYDILDLRNINDKQK